MSKRRNLKSISTPIILGAVSVPLSVALLVGWTLLIGRNLSDADEIAFDVSLLILGAISFLVIVTVIVLLSVFLVREILEVRRQDSFIDSVTHELKSPLASIRLCLETLERPDLPVEKQASLRGMMQADVARLTSFIDDVLQASRVAGGAIGGLNVSTLELGRWLDELTQTVEARLELEPGTIQVDSADGLNVRTDESSLEIVLRNLLGNAVKYSSETPSIAVRATSDGRQVRIEVQDQGIGIEQQDLTRIFSRFYRAPRSDVRKRRGTGLGLFVASALAKHLGGTLQAHSDGPGTGTTMSLTLPASTSEEGS